MLGYGQAMPTITLLERQKRQKDRVNVYLDGEYVFSLNEMDAASLRKGQQLSEIELAQLREKDAIERIFARGLDALSRRPLSEQELRRKLLRQQVSEAVVDAALLRLRQYGYLDDATFAQSWVQSRNRSQPRGQRALRYELRQKGISDAHIAAALGTHHDEEAAAYQLARGRVLRFAGMTRREYREKLGSLLQRRGFSYEIARRVLDQIASEMLEEDPDFFANAPDEDDF